MHKILFADVETTGTDPKVHGLTQISGAVAINGKIKDGTFFDLHLRPFPEDVIEPQALAVQGITAEDLAKPERLAPLEAHRALTSLCCRFVDKFTKRDKMFLVGFAATFDDSFLRALWQKCGDKYYGSLVCWPPIDVAVLAAAKLGSKRLAMPNFKLATVAAAIGIKVEEDKLHDSMYDICLTQKVFDWCMDGFRPTDN